MQYVSDGNPTFECFFLKKINQKRDHEVIHINNQLITVLKIR